MKETENKNMKFFKISMLLNLIIASSMITGSSSDRELDKMMFAQRCNLTRSHGFQGCKNEAQCGFTGFYLATYSPKFLCDNCKFKNSPELFIACAFCRMPWKKLHEEQRSTCHAMCDISIRNILCKNLKTGNDWRNEESLKMAAHRYLGKSESLISRQILLAFGDIEIKRRVQRNPGIYLGALMLENGNKLHAWTDTLEIDPADKKLIVDSNEAENHIKNICEKYNVFGPETGNITLEQIPHGAVTFEEQLDNH